MTKTASKPITFAENGNSIPGDAHLNALRAYMNRVSRLVCGLRPYAARPLAEFGKEELELCRNLLSAAYVMQGSLAPVTDIKEPVFDSLTKSQSLELTRLMDLLERLNLAAVLLVAKVNAAMYVLRNAALIAGGV